MVEISPYEMGNPQTSSVDVDGFTSGASISNQCRTRVPFWAYSMNVAIESAN